MELQRDEEIGQVYLVQIARDRGACTPASFTLETLSIGPWHPPTPQPRRSAVTLLSP